MLKTCHLCGNVATIISIYFSSNAQTVEHQHEKAAKK
jgi:hypothetical protein